MNSSQNLSSASLSRAPTTGSAKTASIASNASCASVNSVGISSSAASRMRCVPGVEASWSRIQVACALSTFCGFDTISGSCPVCAGMPHSLVRSEGAGAEGQYASSGTPAHSPPARRTTLAGSARIRSRQRGTCTRPTCAGPSTSASLVAKTSSRSNAHLSQSRTSEAAAPTALTTTRRPEPRRRRCRTPRRRRSARRPATATRSWRRRSAGRARPGPPGPGRPSRPARHLRATRRPRPRSRRTSARRDGPRERPRPLPGWSGPAGQDASDPRPGSPARAPGPPRRLDERSCAPHRSAVGTAP